MIRKCISTPHLIMILLIALTLGVFSGITDHEFVEYDDDVYVYQNLQVKRGITPDGAKWAFTTTLSGHWHPLSWLSHMLDCELFGLNPAAHHLSSLFLHAVNVLLLFGLLRRMTGATWKSAFVAGLFAIHPLHVEPVAWVSSRKDLLSTLFLFLSLWAYVGYTRSGKGRTYLLCLLFFVLGLLSKSMVVTLPCLLLLLDVWPLERLPWGSKPKSDTRPSTRVWLLEKVPFVLIAGLFSMIAIIAMKGGMSAFNAGPPSEFFFQWHRVSRGLSMILTYLYKAFWPHPISAIYPAFVTPPVWFPLVSAALLLATSFAVLRSRRRPWIVGWFWFLVMLLPFSGILNLGPNTPSDRYTYVPLIGLFILITWVVGELAERFVERRALVGILMAGALFSLGTTARWNLNSWKTSEDLFQNAIRVIPGNAKAYNNLGGVLAKEGRFSEAIRNFHAALDAHPELAQAHNNLGLTLVNLGRFESAVHHFREAIRIKPDYAEANNNWGIALAYMGRFSKAEAMYRSALRLKPDFAEAYNNLGNTLANRGDAEAAGSAYRKALDLRPDYFEANKNLGRLLLSKGAPKGAVELLEKAARLRPEQADVHVLLSNALIRAGRERGAIKHLLQVIRLEPGHAEAHFKLASLLAMEGKTDQALNHYRKAAVLRPDHAPSRFGLGLAYSAEGKFEQAKSEAEILEEIAPPLSRLLNQEIADDMRGTASTPADPKDAADSP